MLNFRKEFYVFEANQNGAAQALAEFDGSMNGCCPYVVGDNIVVFMHTYSSSKYQADRYKESDEYVAKILKKYKLNFKKSIFKTK